MAKGKGQKASLPIENLYNLATQYSKNDDLKGFLDDLVKNHGYKKPSAKNLLTRLSPYIVKFGKTLTFPALASSGVKSIKWSQKGLTISKNSVSATLYDKAVKEATVYDVEMLEDLSLVLKPTKQE